MKYKFNVWYLFVFTFLILAFISCDSSNPTGTNGDGVVNIGDGILINHIKANLSLIQESDVIKAKQKLHIAYGHTSHVSQLIDGMKGLINFKGNLYLFNNGGNDGALDLRDRPFSGASDLGNPNRTAWAEATRNYLKNNPEINVIIWSWCGQVSSASEADIKTYLDLMNGLEVEFPAVKFVYMTGHLDGSGKSGNLNQRNEQIRNYCKAYKKILYDFADIESYDPDGQTNYMVLRGNDNCDYDSNGDGTRDANWAKDWQNSHTEGDDWYNCNAAHSQALNANQKAYAAWNLWVSLAR